MLQKLLLKFFYFVHVDNKKQLFINLNVNKKFDFKIHLYYVKKDCFKNLQLKQFSFRYVIKLIFF